MPQQFTVFSHEEAVEIADAFGVPAEVADEFVTLLATHYEIVKRADGVYTLEGGPA